METEFHAFFFFFLGSEILSRLLKMRRTDEDESVGEALNQAKASSSSSQPAWMRQLETTAKEFLKNLNENLPSLDARGNDINDPLFRFFEREVSLGQKLLGVIRKDLNELIGVCNGEIKQTNHLRSLIGEITKGLFFSLIAPWIVILITSSNLIYVFYCA
jgi:dynein heavy chain 1